MAVSLNPGELLRQRHCHHRACGAIFVICVSCDRGQRYCSAACRSAERRRQRFEANRRYQQTESGRAAHRECQRRYRRGPNTVVTDQPRVTVTEPPSPLAKQAICVCVVCARQGQWFDTSPNLPGEWRRRRRVRQRRAGRRAARAQISTFLPER